MGMEEEVAFFNRPSEARTANHDLADTHSEGILIV